MTAGTGEISATPGGTQTLADDARGGVHWLPFCLINTNRKSDSETTILHEMIHAAYGQSVPHDTDPDSVFYGSNTETGIYEIRTLTKKHAELLRQSYFAAVNWHPLTGDRFRLCSVTKCIKLH